MRRFAATATAVLALATAPLAQAPDADWLAAQPDWIELDDAASVTQLSLSVDQLDDLDLHDAAGQKLGEVEEVIGLVDGTVIGLAVELDDAAGADDDDDEVVVPIASVRLDGERLTTDLTPDALRALPQWDD